MINKTVCEGYKYNCLNSHSPPPRKNLTLLLWSINEEIMGSGTNEIL